MKILGIETSCDETAAAVVEDGKKILSNIVASSVDIHAKTGGIIPEQAARQQLKSIIPVIEGALLGVNGGQWSVDRKTKSPNTKHQTRNTDIDAIAVTVGPGLIGSLLVGVEIAKVLAYLWEKPIIRVNHLVAHVYANWLEPNTKHHSPFTSHFPQFPALALVVSGGHTDLVLMRGHGLLKWIGGTRDDAAGEAFDKAARILGLAYPGGPAISTQATRYQPSTINHQPLSMFPRPMIGEDNYDWSFSGLKTAVLREVQKLDPRAKMQIPRLAAEVQEAITDTLVSKSLRAIKEYKPKSFLLAGGVAANSRLRQKFNLEIENYKLKIDFKVPPPSLCTDNAAAIASYAFFNYRPVDWRKIKADPGLTIMGEA